MKKPLMRFILVLMFVGHVLCFLFIFFFVALPWYIFTGGDAVGNYLQYSEDALLDYRARCKPTDNNHYK